MASTNHKYHSRPLGLLLPKDPVFPHLESTFPVNSFHITKIIQQQKLALVDLRKTMEVTAGEFFSSYQAAALKNDASLVNRSVTPDCKRYLLPQSMHRDQGIPLDLAIDNETYQSEFAKDLAIGSVQRHKVANLVVDVEARRLAATIIAHMLFKVGEEETLVLEFPWFFCL